MKPQQKQIFAALAILSLLIALFPFNFNNLSSQNAGAYNQYITLDGDIRWTPSDNPGTIRRDTYFINGSLTIEAGTHLRLGDNSAIYVKGDLFIEGEEGNPVIIEGLEEFPKYNYALFVESAVDVSVNQAVFRRGGGYGCISKSPGFLNFALADYDCIEAALNVEAETVTIRNSTFDHNLRAVNFFDGGDDSQFVNNIFHNNEDSALRSNSGYELDARGNCWMRPSGPTHPGNPNGLGEKIEGNVDFSDWQECGTDHQPVLIIPGFGGSWNWDAMFDKWGLSPWTFSPTIHDYNSLIKSFEEKGFKKGKDSQIIFYDWRKDNHESAEQFLAPVVDDLKNISFDEKYSIVAHSMGGIVAMDYLQNHGNSQLDKLIFLGTPLGGSAKAYPVWEGGIVPEDWSIMEKYLFLLKIKNLEIGKDNYDMIHSHIPSVKQLLPIYPYVIPEGVSEPVAYDEMHEYNQYLDELFWTSFFESDLFNENTLIIEGSGIPTSKMIDVKDYQGEDDKLWKDGEPENNPLLKDETQGDGTVVNADSVFDFIPPPPGQSSLFSSCKYETLPNIKHTQIPTAAIAKVHDFLFSEPPAHGDYPLPSENKIVFTFASPVEVKITAPDEKFITEGENTIGDGAYYYSDGDNDGVKIVEIQEPQNGEYKIQLTGNGDGEYNILASKQNGDDWSDDETRGNITLGQNINYKVDISAENFEIRPEQSSDTAPPVITVTSPEDGKTYLNDNYALEFSSQIEDAESGIDESSIEKSLDGESFGENILDLSLVRLGEHAYRISVSDKAGNLASEEVKFHITTNINAIRNNLSHYFNLGLIKEEVAYKHFKRKIENLENLFNLLEKAKNSDLKSKLKQMAIGALKEAINKNIDQIIRQIDKKSTQWIDQKAAELIIEGLNAIRP